MKRNWLKKAAALVLSTAMILSLAACGKTEGGSAADGTTKAGGSEKTTAAEKDTEAANSNEGISEDSPYANMGFDFSEHRDMVFYALSDRPADMDKVLDKLNREYLEPWLNVTLSIEFLPWGIASDKYPLLLSGSDPIDMIYTASWMGYTGYANNGAFIELTPEMLQEYLVYSYDDQPEISWTQASVAGKIYGICRTLSECNTYNIIVARQDLLDEAGFTEPIDSFKDLEDAMLAVRELKKDDSGFFCISQRSKDELAYLWYQENGMARLSGDWVYFPNGSEELPDPEDIQFLYETDVWHDYCAEMVKLAAAGCWSENAINDTSDSQLLFESGRTAFMSWNNTVASAGANMEAAGVGAYQLYDVTPDAKAQPGSYADGMISIPISAPDPERSLLVIDCLKSFTDCTWLLCGGIEGEHYVLTEDGYRTEGPKAADYSWGCWNWCIQRNDEPQVYYEDERQYTFDNATSAKIYNPKTAAFVFDTNPVADEISVLDATVKEYSASFTLGMYGDDFETMYQEFMAAIDASYVDVVKEEILRQYREYMENYK